MDDNFNWKDMDGSDARLDGTITGYESTAETDISSELMSLNSIDALVKSASEEEEASMRANDLLTTCYDNYWYPDYPPPPPAPKCECGAEKVGSKRHSTWCCKYEETK